MNKQRLKTLRDALIKYAGDTGNLRFDLREWTFIPDEYDGEDGTVVVRGAMRSRNYCGTTACAIGLAASLPEFNRAGFSIGQYGNIRSPMFRDLGHWEAVR